MFARDRFPELIKTHPELGYDMIWLAAKEEAALEEHLVALGQRTAREFARFDHPQNTRRPYL